MVIKTCWRQLCNAGVQQSVWNSKNAAMCLDIAECVIDAALSWETSGIQLMPSISVLNSGVLNLSPFVFRVKRELTGAR